MLSDLPELKGKRIQVSRTCPNLNSADLSLGLSHCNTNCHISHQTMKMIPIIMGYVLGEYLLRL